ncbi:hybrid sensor histidine kinase/response regulator [Planctomicrobium piriforme]|uniref:histidine kinase n=1 Tax=Planctomicrobium piriforme TaxID=1576369 RepID=A0A1I3QJB5_9PLAN|nr:response regulator [Planctomicrobium piriforme]SFJ33672.1 two-component system, chemotaxis family, sensor kinase CheA [Planctomicrobium piriforme]
MIDSILTLFREESREHLQALERGFLELESLTETTARREMIDRLFRHAHNLKGDSRAVGVQSLQRVSQSLEEVLSQFRQDPHSVSRTEIDEALKRLDAVRDAFVRWEAEQPVEAPDVGERSPDVENVTQAIAEPHVAISSGGEELASLRISSERLDNMLNAVGDARIAQRGAVGTGQQLKELRERLEELQPLAAGQVLSELDALSEQMRRIETDFRQRQLREQISLESLDREIRDARLVPLSTLAESLRRSVRDLSQTLGKPIRYEIDVGDVQLDKVVIEALRSPLQHLIRNAADHGLETPVERQRHNKPEEGTIRLQARRRGEVVEISLTDDGQGISYDAIRQRLISRFGQNQGEVSALTPEQLTAWLFHPGFSTAEVGQISGRGVGLDVVRDTLQRLHGDVRIAPQVGVGTTFILDVPVSISTIRTLSVWAGGQCYGIPTSSVLKTGRQRPSQLTRVQGVPMIAYEGEMIRWIALSELVQSVTGTGLSSDAPVLYLVIAGDERQLAVCVDDIEEERENLLKPLGFPLEHHRGVLGGTIRPDGSVQLVLDLPEIAVSRRHAPATSPTDSSPPARILVVDDSPTTRAILRNLLVSAGFQVRTAVDGVDALDKLRLYPCDLLISDFEMPRLNGVDLTRQVKANWKLPVILVTGREQPEHRRQGLEAGADAYVVKSTFQQENLLEVIRQFVDA